MRKAIVGLLSGILSFGAATKSYAQNNPGAFYHLNNDGYIVNSANANRFIEEKQGADYLIDEDITSVIYSFNSNSKIISATTTTLDSMHGALNINSNNSTPIAGTINSGYSQDNNGWYWMGYYSDTPDFPYSVQGRVASSAENHKQALNVTFQGTVANKPLQFIVNKNGELPVDGKGQWGDLEIIVAYTPSKDVKWLVDHADVAIRDLQHNLLAKYLIKYEFGERKVSNGTAIGYKGFTVTKQ